MNDLIYNGSPINVHDEMLCLTDMWRAAGSPEDKRPAEWARYAGSQWIEFVAENFNVGSAHIEKVFKTVRGGKRPGTWAHWQIGFAYAKYLNHEFHAWCNEVVRERMLQISRRSAVRAKGIVQRKEFTDVLRDHDVDGPFGYAMVTNGIYTGLFSKTAAQLRKERELRKSDSLRDKMSNVELGAVFLSEALASEQIAELDIRGNERCAIAAKDCASSVKKSVAEVRGTKKLVKP